MFAVGIIRYTPQLLFLFRLLRHMIYQQKVLHISLLMLLRAFVWLSNGLLVFYLLNIYVVSNRVRSIIIQQEKAQDREKLLLKFIKIMKVKKKYTHTRKQRINFTLLPQSLINIHLDENFTADFGLNVIISTDFIFCVALLTWIFVSTFFSTWGSWTTLTHTWPSCQLWTLHQSGGWSGRSRHLRSDWTTSYVIIVMVFLIK